MRRATGSATRAATGSAADFIPPHPTLPKLRAAAAGCRGCDLWQCATQTVFGEGPKGARVLIVGEQPGDQEDRAGRPFVGPSGQLLDRGLADAGIDRGDVYVTNAVKHFKWERNSTGKRRIHKKPNDAEVRACHPWLAAEIALVRPAVVVCLGATAAQSLLGKAFRVTRERGKPVPAPFGGIVIASVHPSSVLRAPDREARAQAEREFFADLRAVGRYLSGAGRRVETERSVAQSVEPELQPRRPGGTGRPPAPRGRRRPEPHAH
ncbi:MAG TPA: UdgX family uracil-DNA binding protein [Gemmatimonadaceae bacterium]|nr:UdgX family uracil-DNA binding protein [Gemmatimonadaceae bacterium]